jgi:osmoprotectant transport system ATP-binding protein
VILEKGGRIAQQGTPQEILSDPANDFVRDFVGADKGKRALHVEETGTGRVLVDRDGRLVGVLDEEGRARTSASTSASASASNEAGAAQAPGAPAQGAGPA